MISVRKGNSFVTALEEPGIINDAAVNDTLSTAEVSSRKRIAESPEATAQIESSANEDSSRTHNNPTTSGNLFANTWYPRLFRTHVER